MQSPAVSFTLHGNGVKMELRGPEKEAMRTLLQKRMTDGEGSKFKASKCQGYWSEGALLTAPASEETVSRVTRGVSDSARLSLQLRARAVRRSSSASSRWAACRESSSG